MKYIFTSILFFNFYFSNAQYLAEIYIPDNKGVIGDPDCSNLDVTTCGGHDVAGINWSLSSPGNIFDLTSSSHGFYRNDFLRLRNIGADGVLCFESPVLSMGGSSQTIYVNWDEGNFNGEGVLNYFITGGGANGVHQLDLPSGEVTVACPAGNTLQFQICMTSYSASGTMDFLEISSTASLPVELMKFDAHQTKEEIIKLEWTTATEINNERFEIERSQNGRDFNLIGEITGQGNSIAQHNYSYIDTNPQEGTNYYRLKQMDFDGQYEYSKTVSIDLKEGERYGAFYPNPTSLGIVSLDYNLPEHKELNIAYFEISGKLIDELPVEMEEGRGRLNLNISNLKTGIYLVRIGDDRSFEYRKLIVN